jgi:predicted RecB family nuclease
MKLAADNLLLSPSDVTNFLACEHLTTLELAVARGELAKLVGENPEAELVFRKGREHEAAYLAHLVATGKTVEEIQLEPDLDWERAAHETVEAMRSGVDVVYQAVLVDDGWRGVADFLMRTETPSELGPWSYEAYDTKLARRAKPAYVLQLCFYDEQVGRIQGRAPERIHVVLGNGETASFRAEEFGAYYRRMRERLVEFIEAGRPTTPYPNDHCGICDFLPVCDAWWDEVDHLTRVAGIQRRQVERLSAAGITTLESLGRGSAEPPAGMNAETYAKIRRQAGLQLWARENGRDRFELLEPEADTGLALLPDPSPGDLFFDFEGNPFWDQQGSLEYLWGILDSDRLYTALWAHDHEGEREAFETFVDLVHSRLADDPAMHVYHYAGYEITALKRLMGRYGTREAELDDLLRRGVFVDLYRVVRNGVRVSRRGYGLKELESFLDFERQAEVKDGGSSIVMFEEWMQNRDDSLLDAIAAYNEEDCVATLLLRDWLLERRAEALAQFGAFPTPEPVEAKEAPPEKAERAELREALLDAGEELAAHLLDYHDRERKPVWWAFFDRLEQTHEELLEDSESISGLTVVGEPEVVAKSLAYTFTYPPQEHKLRSGQEVRDPATGRSPGELLLVDRDERIVVIKRGKKVDETPLPKALIPGGPYYTDSQEAALMRIGASLLAGDGRYPAVESVIRREPFPHPIQTTDLDEMKALVLGLDGRHLLIQGPPGTGKTWTSGRLIAHLLANKKTVGAASTSHKAIHNLLEAVEEAAAEIGLSLDGVKKASSGNPESFYRDSDRIANVTDGGACVGAELAGGTAWLFSRDDHDRTLDYLFIDEAGQVSLADALAMGTAARNLVLVGDPQQLDQVIQGTHPGDSALSVLKYLIGDEQTIPPDRGLFLERTFRMHPDVCGYISAEFYEGRLNPAPVTAERTTPLGTGLRWLPVEHEGCRQESESEVERVVAQVEELLGAGVAAGEVVIVAPYNAQVNALRESLPDAVRVGTVDKFQGQEADVVIYSMASSSGEDVPRSLEFLLSRNRLNVAISRARCLAYLVCSPRLLEVNARTIDQMRLANALCRFVEEAE